MRSDLDAVSRWATRRNLRVGEPFSHNFEEECLTLAQLNLAKHRFKEATHLLKVLRSQAAQRKRFYSTLKIDIVLAAGLYALGNQEAALRIMESCVEFSSSEGIVRPFADNAAHISNILFSLRKSKNGTVRIYAQKLLKMCELERSPKFIWKRSAVSHGETLTSREVEILRLIAIGLTNKEIAEQAFVSLNTIKTHIRNIYGKLGVIHREQAILRAKEFNVFVS
jgi:LuxR family maltose regulon positive regulatory protein